MDESIIKQKVQRWVIAISVLILCGKFIAYYLTNSVGIFTDAMESIVNVIAGCISLYSLYWAVKPKDKKHPFGRGKIELISASVEGILISVAGGVIIYNGIKRLLLPEEIDKLDIGIIVIVVAGIINFIMGVYSERMGKKYDSMALIASGKHLKSDTYSTIGLVIGLILLYFTKISWIDSAIAVLFGGIIIFTGISILCKTIANLLDEADMALLSEMAEAINKNRQKDWIDIHNTRIIKYGNYLYIDCDLTLPFYYNVIKSHHIYEKLHQALKVEFSEKIQVSIHSDPCMQEHCEHCLMDDCTYRKFPFENAEKLTLSRITESDDERSKK